MGMHLHELHAASVPAPLVTLLLDRGAYGIEAIEPPAGTDPGSAGISP